MLFYKEVMEFFYFGVKVLYLKMILFCVKVGVLCEIKNIYNLCVEGFVISNDSVFNELVKVLLSL